MTASDLIAHTQHTQNILNRTNFINQHRKSKKKRRHLTVTDEALQEAIFKIIELEHLTHEQFLNKYLKLPETDFEILTNKYTELEELLIKTFGDNESRELQRCMGIFWSILMNCCRKRYSFAKVIEELNKSIDNQNFKGGM